VWDAFGDGCSLSKNMKDCDCLFETVKCGSARQFKRVKAKERNLP
jgi:hypothetical protein